MFKNLKNVVLLLASVYTAASYAPLYAMDRCELTVALGSHKVTNIDQVINEVNSLLKDTLGAAEIEPTAGIQLSMGDFKANVSSASGERESTIKVNIGNRTSVIMLRAASPEMPGDLQIFLSVQAAKEILKGSIAQPLPEKEVIKSPVKEKAVPDKTLGAKISEDAIKIESARSIRIAMKLKINYDNARSLDPTMPEIKDAAFEFQKLYPSASLEQKAEIIGERIRKIRKEIMGIKSLEIMEELLNDVGVPIPKHTLSRYEVGTPAQINHGDLGRLIEDGFAKVFDKHFLGKDIQLDLEIETEKLAKVMAKIAEIHHQKTGDTLEPLITEIHKAFGMSSENFAVLIGDVSGGKIQKLQTRTIHVFRSALENELAKNPNLQPREVLQEQIDLVDSILNKAKTKISGLTLKDVSTLPKIDQFVAKFDELCTILEDHYDLSEQNLLIPVAKKHFHSPILSDVFKTRSSLNRNINRDKNNKTLTNFSNIPDFYMLDVLKEAERVIETGEALALTETKNKPTEIEKEETDDSKREDETSRRKGSSTKINDETVKQQMDRLTRLLIKFKIAYHKARNADPSLPIIDGSVFMMTEQWQKKFSKMSVEEKAVTIGKMFQKIRIEILGVDSRQVMEDLASQVNVSLPAYTLGRFERGTAANLLDIDFSKRVEEAFEKIGMKKF